MKRLNVYLRFNGNCRQAMQFYKDCLGGELDLMTVGETAMASQMPPAEKDKVMHSTLDSDGMVIMGSDMAPSEGLVKGNTICVCVNGTDIEGIQRLFSKLSAGGKVGTPFRKEFFGMYGDFTDKFGVDWMFQADMPQK
jgi:PhnB protein